MSVMCSEEKHTLQPPTWSSLQTSSSYPSSAEGQRHKERGDAGPWDVVAEWHAGDLSHSRSKELTACSYLSALNFHVSRLYCRTESRAFITSAEIPFRGAEVIFDIIKSVSSLVQRKLLSSAENWPPRRGWNSRHMHGLPQPSLNAALRLLHHLTRSGAEARRTADCFCSCDTALVFFVTL